INFLGDINLQGNTVFDVKKITGYLGTWSIDEEGKLIAVKIETGELTVKNPVQEKNGITIYDRATGEPVCVFSENGVLRSESGVCGSASPTTSGSVDNSQSSINDSIINETTITTPIVEETATSTPSASSEPAPAPTSEPVEETTATSTPQAEAVSAPVSDEESATVMP
ncbi:MAG: hypothetical protein HY617_01910, partial [Candidatus Sungbacteria bacterium]|nr:hypothetical protein [Candidatus Sungbacteria bacterium]